MVVAADYFLFNASCRHSGRRTFATSQIECGAEAAPAWSFVMGLLRWDARRKVTVAEKFYIYNKILLSV